MQLCTLLTLVVSLVAAAQLPLVQAQRIGDVDGDRALHAGLPPHIFQQMGQYSPRYLVGHDSQMAPPGCKVDVVSTLERHGARHFTDGALKRAKATVTKLQASLKTAQRVPPEMAFILDAQLQKETSSLVPYGALQAWYSGKTAAATYPELARSTPFVRGSGDVASGNDRVILTARYWRLGFEGHPFPTGNISTSDQVRNAPNLPQTDLDISELPGKNNTLDVSTCTAENNLPASQGEDGAQARYGNSTVLPTIGARLQEVLQRAGAGAVNLTYTDVLNIGNLCSFETLGRASVVDGQLRLDGGRISPWCGIFRDNEWSIYGYANDAGKYYGAGYGNPFFKALGEGWIRELFARFESRLPAPGASLNSTLDGSSATFPVPDHTRVFFDGTHDNNIGPIAAAFGLFDGPKLSTDFHAERAPHRWVFSQIGPLQGKITFEKLSCAGSRSPYLRVRANGAVQSPRGASWCPRPDARAAQGLCAVDVVHKALAFVNSNEEWAKCDA